MKYIARIFASIIKWMPFSAFLTMFDYLIVGALTPAIVTIISAGLFDAAAQTLSGGPGHDALFFYAGLYLGVYLVNDVMAYFRSIVLNAGIYEKGTAYFRIGLYEKLAKLPLILFEDVEIQNKKERADKAVDDETMSAIFNHTLRFARSAIQVAGTGAALAFFNARLLPLSLLSVLPYLVSRIVRGKEFYYVKKHQAKKTRMLTYLWGLLTSRDTVKEMRVMGFDGYVAQKWRTVREEADEELWALQRKDAFSLFWCDGIRIAGYGASIAVTLALALGGHVSIGAFGAAIAAFLSLQNSMQNFLIGLGRFPEQLAFAHDYYDFFETPEEADGRLQFPGLSNEIKLEGVSFKYPNSGGYALKNICLTLRKGEIVAVLGENGSGKTTLSKILLGLYAPETGRVAYDGADVKNFSRASLYSKVSAVAQDFVAYKLTLRENVAISDITKIADDDAITGALRGAAFGVSPGSGKSEGPGGIGLDGMMGREFEGAELSGGQWQKLAIARGLFKKSELIVLDEPTSALDPLIETEILTNFIAAAHGKTALIISHRVGLCKLADRIVVMKNGEIVEQGDHAGLLSTGGEYAKLYNAQAKWYI